MLIAAEVRLGLVKLSRGNSLLASRWWRYSVDDELKDEPETPTDVIPNRGLDLLVAGRPKVAFAWFASMYMSHKILEDPALIDVGYYRNLLGGLNFATVGRYADAVAFFDRDIRLSSNGSDAYFFKGVATLAQGNANRAIRIWTTGIWKFSFGRGYPPRSSSAFVLSAVYLWLHAPTIPLDYPRDINPQTF